ncbi:MAG: sugar-transfer associated ATP-grasp domain-containing protein [Rhodospirillales bacterium]
MNYRHPNTTKESPGAEASAVKPPRELSNKPTAKPKTAQKPRPAMKPRVLEREKAAGDFDLAKCMAYARQHHGKSYLGQVIEMAKLAFAPMKLTPEEYYAYRLYDDKQFTETEKYAFIGLRAQTAIHTRTNDIGWWGIAHDKLTFDAALRGLGLPRAQIHAIYHPDRMHGRVPVIRHNEDLAAYLREEMPYPFFAKPVMGMHSVGVAKVVGIDRSADELIIANAPPAKVQAFADEVVAYGTAGYLFQECLKPHVMIEEMCGPRLSTARVLIALTDQGPVILRSMWKIPAGCNVADNFWRSGNILAAVDAETGKVERAVQGTGPDQRWVERHPDTEELIYGAVLPDWENLKLTAIAGALAFPQLRLQAWDVAMTERGPVLLELNVGGDFNLPQVATGRPMMDKHFVAFLESC